MKFNLNPKYTIRAIYAFLVLAAAMLFYMAIGNIHYLFGWLGRLLQFLQPIVYGCVFAFLLNPLLRIFDNKLLPRLFKDRLKPKPRRTVAIILTYLTALICVTVFISMVVPQLIASLSNLAANMSSYFLVLRRLYNDFTQYLDTLLNASSGDEFTSLLSAIMERMLDSLGKLMESGTEYISSSLGSLLTASARFTTGLINLTIGIIVSVYLLFDHEKLFAQCHKIIVALFPQRACKLLFDIGIDCNRILSGFVVGKVIDSLIIGVLCFIGLIIMQMPYAVLISVVVCVTNVIPYFGPFIGAIPSFLILFIASPVHSLWFLVFIFFLQQFDGNILGPKILGDTIGLSAFWIIFSIMLFSGLFGMLGMFIGVPLFAILYSLVKRFIAFLLEQKGLSSNTRDYDSTHNKLLK